MSAIKKNIAIGVHIGGKGVKCAAVDLESKEIIAGSHFESGVDKDAQARHIVTMWSMQIKKSISAINPDHLAGIGIVIPGPFDYANGIADFKGVPKYEELGGTNITEEISKRLGLKEPVPIRYINDAIGFSIGGDWGESQNSFKKVISIMIGEGFGSAFMNNGTAVISGSSVPPRGVVYNLPLEGKIAEEYFSVRGLMSRYKAMGESSLNIRTLMASAKSKKPAQELFADMGEKLGEFLTPIVKKFGADAVVFTDEVGSELHLFEEALKKQLENNSLRPHLMVPDSNYESFILGGARLIDEKFWKSIENILPDLD